MTGVDGMLDVQEKSEDFSSFLEFMESRSVLSPEQVKRALKAHQSTNHPADIVLIELGLVREIELARHFCDFFGIEFREQLPQPVDQVLVDTAGMNFLETNMILPLTMDTESVVTAVADPFSSAAVDALGFQFDRKVQIGIFPRSTIVERLVELREAIAVSDDQTAEVIESVLDVDVDDIERLRDIAREAPVIRFVSQIIQQAVDRGATDIHIEPRADNICVRFRHDGLLSVAETAPKSMHAGIATRIKILSRLNIAERRMPQDGRMRIAVRGQEIDLRVSILPSVHGETFVLRILDKSGVSLNLDSLGYDKAGIAHLKTLAQAPNGIILITGPTGSGKTTTLYSVLQERKSESVKIFTVEDPVEYRVSGVTQLQVEPQIDLTFARALRSVLRQDPDIILIGEIRDRETAQIAIQASLTGHLVFSTLHTNSAAGALTRLLDMGVDGYLIGATIRAVVAQRLVRQLCKVCDGRRESAGVTCGKCNGTGFSGRTVIYELLEVNKDIRNLISAGATEAQIRERAAAGGHIGLAENATMLIDSGITTREEILRVLELGGE